MKSYYLLSVILVFGALPNCMSAIPTDAQDSDGNSNVPTLDGIMLLGNQQLFALRFFAGNGKSGTGGWLKIGESFNGMTLVRYENQSATLFIKDAAGTIHTLRLPEERVRKPKLPPLSRAQALKHLDGMIAGMLEQRARFNAPVQLDFNVDPHITEEKRADLMRARLKAEASGDSLYIAGWDERMGLYTITVPNLTRILPDHIKANLRQDDLDTFNGRYMIAAAELQAARLYASNPGFYNAYKQKNDSEKEVARGAAQPGK